MGKGMTKEEFGAFAKMLEGRGYKKQAYNAFGHEEYSYYKGFARKEDEYGEMRSQYIVFFKVYDYFLFAERTHRDDLPKAIFVSPHIMVSRDSDEREEYETMYNEHDVDYIESLAERFFEFIKENVSLPSHDE